MKQLRIPVKLLPHDGRFGCGPAKVRPEQMNTLFLQQAKLLGTSHRNEPVKNLVRSVQEKLAQLFGLPPGYEIVLGNGGATAFWNAAAFSLIQNRSEHLVFGEFGAKFAAAATTPFLEKPCVLTAEAGALSRAKIVPGVDVYAWPHNETSTGVVAPIKRIADPEALTVIDGTSAAGGIDFDVTETDVYYFSPQKNLASEGGLWLAAFSPAAVERVQNIAATSRYIPEFLRLDAAIKNSRLAQTLNTPSITTLILLNDQLDWINKQGGLAWADQRTRESSSILYNWAEFSPYATPFVSDPAHRSPVVVTLNFSEEIDAAEICRVLRANGIVDIEPYRKQGHNQIRIATFVAIEPADVHALTHCIDYVVEKLY